MFKCTIDLVATAAEQDPNLIHSRVHCALTVDTCCKVSPQDMIDIGVKQQQQQTIFILWSIPATFCSEHNDTFEQIRPNAAYSYLGLSTNG